MPAWSLIITLAGLSMVGAFAIDTFLPSFPAIAEEFSIGMGAVQQALSLYLLAFSVMSLFYGTLSDSFGRRRVVLWSLVLFTIASAGAALSSSFAGLLFFRVLQGLSAGGGLVVGQAVIRDRFSGPAAQRLMSQVTMVFGLAPAVAPVIGGQLHAHFGWRSVFVFMTGIGAALILATLRWLPESLPPASRVPFHPASLAGSYRTATRHPQFMARALATAFAFGGLGLYISSAASFIIHILHLPETAFAWLFIPMIGGMVTGSATGARLARHGQPARVIRLAVGCMATAAVLNLAYNSLFTASIPWAVVPIMLYTFGLGLFMPTMTLTALDLFPQMRGLAASLLGFLRMLVFSMMSGIVAPLLFDSALKLAAGLMACLVLAAACWRVGLAPGEQGSAGPGQ